MGEFKKLWHLKSHLKNVRELLREQELLLEALQENKAALAVLREHADKVRTLRRIEEELEAKVNDWESLETEGSHVQA